MNNLFFNISFDLVGISLILFVIWFFVNFNNAAAAFKWFSLSILTLLTSVIMLSYGATKLPSVSHSLPFQNQTKITNLKHEISHLKANKSKDYNRKKEYKPRIKATSSQGTSSDSIKSSKVPSRIVNARDNEIVKKDAGKHEVHIKLIAKVINPTNNIIVRGVHSNQEYYISGKHDLLTTGEFVVIKGRAINVTNNVINIKSTSVKRQFNS